MISISHWGMFAVEGYEKYQCRHMDCFIGGKSYSYLLWLDYIQWIEMGLDELYQWGF